MFEVFYSKCNNHNSDNNLYVLNISKPTTIKQIM